jgi:hypothetical protein
MPKTPEIEGEGLAADSIEVKLPLPARYRLPPVVDALPAEPEPKVVDQKPAPPSLVDFLGEPK